MRDTKSARARLYQLLRIPKLTSSFILQLLRTLYILRAQLVTTIIAVITLSYAAQTREIYGRYLEAPAENSLQIVFALGGLLIATFTSWSAGRWISILWHRARSREDDHMNSESGFTRVRKDQSLDVWLNWAPGVIAAFLPLAVALGVYYALMNQGNAVDTLYKAGEILQKRWPAYFENLPSLAKISDLYFYTCIIIPIVLGSFVGLSYLRDSTWKREGDANFWLTNPIYHISIYGIVACFITLFAVIPDKSAEIMGAITIFFVFISILLVVLGQMVYLYDRFSVPLLTILATVAFVFWLFGWNAHSIDLIDRSMTAATPLENALTQDGVSYSSLPEADSAFRVWLESRPDRGDYLNRPYPVFLIAAAGGGLYAAQHSALFLSRVQDRCRKFADHTFALSGVSGGSLGISLFAALASNSPAAGSTECSMGATTGPRHFEKISSAILDQDFLSPIIGSGLFPNFAQAFIPLSFNSLNRATAFELALERAWTRILPADPNPMSQGFLEGSTKNRSAMALALNATDVDRGERVTISPFKISYFDAAALSGISWFYEPLHPLRRHGNTQQYRFPDLDLKLSTAITLSARFPGIFEPGIFTKGVIRRLVDGGYTENSGVETMLEILEYLSRFELAPEDRKEKYKDKLDDPNVQGYLKDPWIRIYPIVLRSIYDATEVKNPAGASSLAPLEALMAVREGRSRSIVTKLSLRRQTCFEITSTCTTEDREKVPMDVRLNLRSFRVPLAWQLSYTSRNLIAQFSGVPATESLPSDSVCEPSNFRVDDVDDRYTAVAKDILRSRCMIKRIVRAVQ